MKLFENGVGRPSNEIKKKRKIFIASAIALCIALVSVFAFALTKVNTDRLKGATYNGSSHISHHIRGDQTYVSNCNLVVPVEIKNINSSKKIVTITGAKLTTANNNTYVSINHSQSIKKDGKYHTVNYKFPVTNLPSNKVNIRLVTYFKISGDSKTYYKTDRIALGSNQIKGINSCKKTLITLSCGKDPKADREFSCSAKNGDGKGVAIVAQNNNLASGYTGKGTGTVKLKYKKEGTYSVTATIGSSSKTVEVKVGPADIRSKKTLKCSSNVSVNKEFKCEANQNAMIQFGAYKSIAEGYGSSAKGILKMKVKTAGKYVVTARFPDGSTKSITINVKDSSKKNTTTSKKTPVAKNTTTSKKTPVKSTNKTTTKKTTVKSTAKKTTTKKVSSSSSTIASYNINYGITKVTKTGANGEKKLEFKVTKLGKNVKYYNHAVCFERDACIGANGDETRYKGMTAITEAKDGSITSLDITTLSPELLNQDFYVRVMTYDKNQKFIYYKTHHFYVNPITASTSLNKNISDESKVQIGDFTGTTHDFLFSLKSDKVKSTYQANYGIPSVKKLSEVDIDQGGVKKSVNIAMHDFGEDVKYVSFVICNELKYCKKTNAIEYVSEDPERGSVLTYVEPEHGKEFPIEIITEDEDMLNQKLYVRIYSYDANKKLLFSKVHEYTTGEKTKLGVKKESEIKVGDRVISDVTKAIGYKKY